MCRDCAHDRMQAGKLTRRDMVRLLLMLRQTRLIIHIARRAAIDTGLAALLAGVGGTGHLVRVRLPCALNCTCGTPGYACALHMDMAGGCCLYPYRRDAGEYCRARKKRYFAYDPLEYGWPPRQLSNVLPNMNVNERGCECKCDARRLITCIFPENKDEARPRYSVPGIAASRSPRKILSLAPTSALKQKVRGAFGSLSKSSTNHICCARTSIFVLKHRAYGYTEAHLFPRSQANMATAKIPLEPPPDYDDAAHQHGAPAPSKPAVPAVKPPPRGPFPLDIPVLNALRGKRVILASASPRRKQLLGQVCFLPFPFSPVPCPNCPGIPHPTLALLLRGRISYPISIDERKRQTKTNTLPDRSHKPRDPPLHQTREPLQNLPLPFRIRPRDSLAKMP